MENTGCLRLPRAQIGSLTLDYVEYGSGKPIVFIPGLTEFKEEFVFQFRGLEDGYRVISYDVRRGLKRSTDYNLDLLVEDLRKFLDHMNLGHAVIAGHSFGALIAMQFAIQYPDMTDALILASAFPSHQGVSPKRMTSWISSTGHPFHKSLGTSFKMQMARLLGRKTAGTLAMQDEVQAVRMIAREAAATSATTIGQRMRIIQKADFREALPLIVAPTLIVAGARDKPFFLTSAQEMYERIPNASLEVIEGGGHFSFLTRHDQFNAAVDEFLTAHLAEIA